MRKLLSNPTVRLAGRALVAAALAALTTAKLNTGDGSIAWRSIVVGAGLAFVEVFTPLNSLVGLFKQTP